jgi:monoamine oxidase
MLRRDLLTAAAGGAALAGLYGCDARRGVEHISGGFNGVDVTRGHALRDAKATPPQPARTQRTRVVIAGGGIAGLAAARALRQAGVDDFVLLELEDSAGGNSRAGSVGGIACPLGAHYLPIPGDTAHEVADLLEELGLRKRVAGRLAYDERTLCHSPQERLYFNGTWQDGLLPVHDVGESTLVQYRSFAAKVDALTAQGRFAIPVFRSADVDAHRALDAVSFASWLAAEGLDDAHLRWYLDYCCRDDYGAGLARVSAWAGIHYFASRHGFHAPGADAEEREGLLTWPEGNGWLAQRLVAPLTTGAEGRLRTGCSVLAITEERHGVTIDALHHASNTVQRWQADRCIVALPVFIAARVVRDPPAVLQQAAAGVRYAPWMVANVHIDAPLTDRPPGAAPSWDNVIYDARPDSPRESGVIAEGLGYVDARHQSLDPRPGPSVLTYYQALGDRPDGRRQLLEQPWTFWRDEVLAALAAPHPDLIQRAQRIEITRYGHAMAIPLPGALAAGTAMQPELRAGRLHFAHADWSGYSIFEEAFTRGHLAGLASVAA